MDDVDADNVNIMGSWYGQVENGSNTHFLQMMDWLETADLSDSLQYQYLTSLVDIDDFIDYQLMEGFDANYDWPANNMRCYQYENSLWRWILYDGDAAFGAVNRLMDQVMTYQGDDLWPSSSQATLLLRRCLQSPQFMERFGNRLYQLYSTTFAYSSTSPHLRLAQQEVAPEVTWQSERFHMPTDSTSWLNAIEQIDGFLRLRPNYFVQQMERLILTKSEGDFPPGQWQLLWVGAISYLRYEWAAGEGPVHLRHTSTYSLHYRPLRPRSWCLCLAFIFIQHGLKTFRVLVFHHRHTLPTSKNKGTPSWGSLIYYLKSVINRPKKAKLIVKVSLMTDLGLCLAEARSALDDAAHGVAFLQADAQGVGACGQL